MLPLSTPRRKAKRSLEDEVHPELGTELSDFSAKKPRYHGDVSSPALASLNDYVAPVSRASITGEALLVPFRGQSSSSTRSNPCKSPRRSPRKSPQKASAVAVSTTRERLPLSWLDIAADVAREPSHAGVYASLRAAGPPEDSSVKDQVEVDIVRTDLGDADADTDQTRAALRHVLHAFARHDASTGYVQGTHAACHPPRAVHIGPFVPMTTPDKHSSP